MQDIPQTTNNKNVHLQKNNFKNDIVQKNFITKETIDLFKRIYGKNAVVRLLYIEQIILGLKDASLYEKLFTIDQLINRIHFMPDNKQWHKKNYWATPLEIIGTNYGDTEDMALLKYVLLLKVGINSKDIQIIQKDIPFDRKHKQYKENISLFYFTKKYVPLVLDYHFRGGEIYKYKEQFNFTYITTSSNKVWDFIFHEDIKSTEVDKILNYIQETKTLDIKQ